MLLLATWNQGKSTLRCRCQSTGDVIDLLPHLLSFSILWTRCIFSANASGVVVVVVVVLVLIFFLLRLRRRCRFLGPVVYPPPPPSLSLIPRMRHVFLVLCRRLRCCRWVRGPILFCQCIHSRRQYPDPVYTLAPPRLKTFTQTCFIFCFLNWHHRCRCQDLGLPVNTPAPPPLRKFTQTRCIFFFLTWRHCCCRRDLGLILLYRRICHGRQFLRPVITTQQPPSSSPNLQSLGHTFYYLSSANNSVIVVNSMGQAVKYFLPLGC